MQEEKNEPKTPEQGPATPPADASKLVVLLLLVPIILVLVMHVFLRKG